MSHNQLTDYREPPKGFIRGLFILALLIIATLCIISCKTIKEIPVETIRTEIEYKDRLQIDSVYIKDSIYVRQSNDTIYVDKWQYKWIYKELIDTAYICHTDSVPYTVEVVKEVNRLSDFQRNCIWGFWILLVGIIVVIVLKIRKLFL